MRQYNTPHFTVTISSDYLITFDINTVKHPWFTLSTWINQVMFNRRSVDFKTISVPFTCAHLVRFFVLLFWRHGVEWGCDVIADVDNGWGECILPAGGDLYTWNVRFDSCVILSYFLNCFTFHVIQGIKNGCPLHCGDQGHAGLCFGYVPARTSDQGPTLCASDLHNTRATVLNPFNNTIPRWI